MKVTPISRKFGKYLPGDVFDLPDRTAKVLIKVKRLEAADGESTNRSMMYQTRALVAAPVQAVVELLLDSAGMPWDATIHASSRLKNSDGTWRKKPGRVAA